MRRLLLPLVAAVLVSAPLQVVVAAEPGDTGGSSTEGLPPVGEPVERKHWDWTLVDERGIALGGGGLDQDDVEDLRARGFEAVLNLRLEHPDEEKWVREAGMDYGFVPVGYSEEDIMTVDQIEEAVAFIEKSVEEGKLLYVHCTGGWHRSASAIVAYYMKTNGWRYAEAWEHLREVRPKIEERYAESMLLYEAHLFDEPKLLVDMWTEHWDLMPNDTVDVTAYVHHLGKPVEGAQLTFAADHGTLRQERVSDADGLARFTFTPEGDTWMQFVHVWAEKEGLIRAYDRNVFWLREPEVRDPTVMDLETWNGTVEPGEPLTLGVKVAEADGGGANALITVTSSCELIFRDWTGWDGSAEIVFDAPLEEGTYTLLVRANRFPVEPIEQTVELVVGDGQRESPCEASAEPADADPSSSAPEADSPDAAAGGGDASVVGAAGSALGTWGAAAAFAAVALGVAAGAWRLTRR